MSERESDGEKREKGGREFLSPAQSEGEGEGEGAGEGEGEGEGEEGDRREKTGGEIDEKKRGGG